MIERGAKGELGLVPRIVGAQASEDAELADGKPTAGQNPLLGELRQTSSEPLIGDAEHPKLLGRQGPVDLLFVNHEHFLSQSGRFRNPPGATRNRRVLRGLPTRLV